jgi:hypothetical protein
LNTANLNFHSQFAPNEASIKAATNDYQEYAGDDKSSQN